MKCFSGSIFGRQRDVLAPTFLNNHQKETIVKKPFPFKRFTSLLAAPLVGAALTLSSFGASAQLAQPDMFWSAGVTCAQPVTAAAPVQYPVGGGDVTVSLCVKDLDPASPYICDMSMKVQQPDLAADGLFAVASYTTAGPGFTRGLLPAFPLPINQTIAAGRDLGVIANDPEEPVDATGGQTVLMGTYVIRATAAAGVGPYVINTSLGDVALGGPAAYPTILGTSDAPDGCGGATPGTYTRIDIAPPASLTLVQQAGPVPVVQPPTVTPATRNYSDGGSATFACNPTAATTLPVTYAWEYLTTAAGAVWTPIAGAASATLTVQNLTQTDNGTQFRCSVTNGAGTAASTTFGTLNRVVAPHGSTASIPVMGPVGLVLMALALGGLAFRQRRRV